MTPTSHRATARTIALVSAVIGGLVLLGLGGSTAVAVSQSFAASSGSTHERQTAPVAGVTQLAIDSHSGRVTVHFADVPDAVLEVSGERADEWRLLNRGDVLAVEKRQRWLGGLCFLWCWGERTDVTLTLPEALNDGSLDASIEIASGELEATGVFQAVDVEVGSGTFRFDGAAASFSGEVASGNAEMTVAGPSEFSLDIASGDVEARVTGAAPRTVGLEVASGDVRLELPNSVYRVQQDVASGDVKNELRTSPDARSTVTIDVSSGDVTVTGSN